ncbi:MAG: ABC transporter substrate-binding protein [Oscillospiraceae bacterium]|jgi:oligogalacturonide transport system substrate-binding protein|nr:ABC transporter substrate-binding protein [Oscillospiraceae bacterium]
MKKVISCLIVALLICASFAGCGGGQSSSEPASSAPPASNASSAASGSGAASTDVAKDPVTIRFSWWGGDARHEATLKVIEAFQDAYPYITVEPEYGAADGYNDKLTTQLASGTAPDVVQIDPSLMPSIIKNGDYFFDLRAEGFDLSNFDDNFISKRSQGLYSGKQYGLPSGAVATTTLFNPALADAVEIDLTKEQFYWDDFIEWGKKVRAHDSGMYLFGVNTNYLATLVTQTMIRQVTGSTAIVDEKMEVVLTEEQLTGIFEYIKSLYDNEVVPPVSYMAAFSGDNLQNDPNWIDGKYDFTMTYTSMLDVFISAAPDVELDVGLLPLVRDGVDVAYTIGCPQNFSIPSATKHKEEAFLFLDYWYNNETSMLLQGSTRSLPPTSAARAICAEAGVINPLVAKAGDIAEACSTEVEIIDTYSFASEGRQMFIDAVEQIGYATMTPAQAAKFVIDGLNGLIK